MRRGRRASGARRPTCLNITTDPGIEVTFLIVNLSVAGKHFSSASDNGNGDNTMVLFTPDLLPTL